LLAVVFVIEQEEHSLGFDVTYQCLLWI